MCEVARAKARARQAKRRAKLMEDSEAHEKYLEIDCQRKASKSAAASISMTPGEKEEHQLQERIRVRDYRANRKS